MDSQRKRGALIVVEGLDRAGKSSQCERLRDALQASGHAVKYIRFPGIYFPQLCRETPFSNRA
jgi:dTMP kinase